MKNVNFGWRQFFQPTPAKAKKWGAAFGTISVSIGTLGYLVVMPLYIHIGAVCLFLSVILPLLFGETELKQDVEETYKENHDA